MKYQICWYYENETKKLYYIIKSLISDDPIFSSTSLEEFITFLNENPNYLDESIIKGRLFFVDLGEFINPKDYPNITNKLYQLIIDFKLKELS